MNAEVFTGQAITCGGWSLAINMQWANTIVDSFELVRIPRAPHWLIGAVNIDGSIIPVVDLSVYFVPNAAPMVIDRHHRILVGGKREESAEGAAANDSVFAILFNGLPLQIQYTREAMDASHVIPERLRELSLDMAKSNTPAAGGGVGKVHFEMNTDKFVDFLSMSLI
ncbi:MAG: chemotaxis protein CheW [Burkholderiaceae bacterium]